MLSTDASPGRLVRRVWIAAAVGWAVVVVAVLAMVAVRDTSDACHEPHDQPAAIGGWLALIATAYGFAVVVVAMVVALRARRRRARLDRFGAAFAVAILEPVVAASVFVIFLRDTFTICF